MTRYSLRSCLFSLSLSLAAIACSSDTSAPKNGTGGQGSGGVVSTGGNTGSGGGKTGGTGGDAQPGSGGRSATGGDAATGGSPASGGSSSGSTGGTTRSGGATGSGGNTSATGGSAGGAGGGSGGTAGTIRTGGAGSGGRTDAGAGNGGAIPGSGGMNSGGSGGGSGGQSMPDASTGGSGGTTAYNPCKASPCVILPLGDSITHGFGSSDDAGYRSPLFKLIVAANQNVTFVGSLSNGPSTVSGKTFPKKHEGHDGISIAGITGYVPPAKAFATTPHIVLLHIGTNDMTSNANATTAANQLDTLVTNLVKAAPDALILVAKIIPLFYQSATYDSYAGKIPGIVSAHAAKNEHVVMVDMTSFPSSDFGNGVHPSDKGYAFMADLWYKAIKDYLP